VKAANLAIAAAGLLLTGAIRAETGQQTKPMSVGVFLAKADALKAKGAMALFSSDVSMLKLEVANSAQAFRRQLKVEAANGRPSACPPKQASLSSDALLAHLRGYPATARDRITVPEAVAQLLRKQYPCPSR
jgi:hypothetical protein